MRLEGSKRGTENFKSRLMRTTTNISATLSNSFIYKHKKSKFVISDSNQPADCVNMW